MPPGIDKLKTVSKRCGKTGRIVTADGETAASLRPVKRERADDHATAGAYRSFQARDVCGFIGGLGQEVKRGPVVPDVEGLHRTPFGDVRDDPLNLARPRAESAVESMTPDAAAVSTAMRARCGGRQRQLLVIGRGGQVWSDRQDH